MSRMDKMLSDSLHNEGAWPVLEQAEAARIKGSVFQKLEQEQSRRFRLPNNKTLLIAAMVAVGLFLVAAGYYIMPQDKDYHAVAYDKDGNFIAYYITDEHGQTTVLDHIPDIPKGDAVVVGYEDVFLFHSETYDCVDGIVGPHQRKNCGMAVYTNGTGSWSLKQGQSVTLTFHTIPVEGRIDGQTVWFGYGLHGEYYNYGDVLGSEADRSHMFLGETTLSFTAPEDGDYQFFIVNFSSDTLYIESCEIVVQ